MKKSLFVLTSLLVSSPLWANGSHAGMDHSSMDGAAMQHGEMQDSMMNHSEMDHSQMQDGSSKMDHSQMKMAGMSAVGMPAPHAQPDKVVHVLLSDDNRITFKQPVTIKENDVVQFVIMNTGKQAHQFVIGSNAEQKQYQAMMQSMTSHDHDSGNAVTVEPRKAKQITWHFHGDNQVELACHLADHYQAGMVHKLTL